MKGSTLVLPQAVLDTLPEAVREATVALAEAAPVGAYCVVAAPVRQGWDVRVATLDAVRRLLVSVPLPETDPVVEELGRDRPGCLPVLVSTSAHLAAGHVRLASAGVA